MTSQCPLTPKLQGVKNRTAATTDLKARNIGRWEASADWPVKTRWRWDSLGSHLPPPVSVTRIDQGKHSSRTDLQHVHSCWSRLSVHCITSKHSNSKQTPNKHTDCSPSCSLPYIYKWRERDWGGGSTQTPYTTMIVVWVHSDLSDN